MDKPRKIFRQLFTHLLLLAMLLSPGLAAASPAPQGERAAAPTALQTVKVLLDASRQELGLSLSGQGARLLADYGGFSLWQVPQSSLASLTGQQSAPAPGAAIPGLAIPTEIDRIWLRGGAYIDTPSSEPPVPATLRQALSDGPQFWMAQFIGPVRDSWLRALVGTGVEIVTYMPNNAYVVWGDGESLAAVQALAEQGAPLQWSGAYHPAYRLAPDLQRAAEGDPDAPVAVTVQLYRTGQLGESLQALRRLGGAVFAGPENVLGFTNLSLQVPAGRLLELAAWDDVFNVESWSAPELFDEVQNQIIAGNVTISGGNVVPGGTGYLAWLAAMGFPTTPSSYPLVDVIDDGIDQGDAANVLHPDFYELGSTSNPDRIVYIGNCTTDATGNAVGGHGNLNAGIVGSYNDLSGVPHQDAGGYRIGLGVSPYGRIAGTKIFRNSGSFDLSQCGNTYAGLVASSYLAGATFTTNSWGANTGGAYTTSSQAYDALTRDAYGPTTGNQEMLHVFAAGNAGSGANTIGSPGSAKNVLTVGATENVRDDGVADGCGYSGANNADDIATFSSRGPTDDNRVKPDVMAPGTHVQGPASQDPGFNGTGVCGGSSSMYYPDGQTLYTWSSGTSHSTPAVAGAASLVYEYYGRVLNPGMQPSPAMLKALLLNSPRYLDGSGTGGTLPSNNQGWGDVNLGMLFDGSDYLLYDQLSDQLFSDTGQDIVIEASVIDTSRPLRVTLVWTDKPGSTTGAAYVNNLDLEVTVGGVTYKGNVFSGAFSDSGGVADPRNNVENVFLPAGVSGWVSVRVLAANIADDGVPGNGDPTDQDFALVVYNAAQIPVPALSVEYIQLAQVDGNGDSVVDPGETFSMQLPLRNMGTADATGVEGILALAAGSAAVTAFESPYPDIAAGEVQTNTLPFQFTVGLDQACGDQLGFVLTATHNLTRTMVQTFGIDIGLRFTGSPVDYISSDVPKSIPDNDTAGVDSTITITDTGRVADVNVTIGELNHTYDGDLILSLVSPLNSTVLLSNRRGGSSNNFIGTVFDDSASTPISAGSAPFTGSFQPETPLSALNDEPLNGVWTLNIADVATFDTGTLQSWSMQVTPFVYVCTPFINSAPTAQNDSGEGFSTDEDTPFTTDSVLANDSDADPGTDLVVSSFDASTLLGSLGYNGDGSFDYDPEGAFESLLPGEQALEVFTYVASDGFLTDTAVVTLTVSGVNDFPQVSAGDDLSALEGEQISFAGTFSDPGLLLPADGESLRWDFGDGSVLTGTLTPQHAYGDDGLFTVTLTVTDTFGAPASDSLLVTVANEDPLLQGIPDRIVAAGELVLLSGNLSDPGWLDTHQVVVTWAPGQVQAIDLAAGETGFAAFHTYADPGQYPVAVEATDDDGGVDSLVFTVTVLAPGEFGYSIFMPRLSR